MGVGRSYNENSIITNTPSNHPKLDFFGRMCLWQRLLEKPPTNTRKQHELDDFGKSDLCQALTELGHPRCDPEYLGTARVQVTAEIKGKSEDPTS